MHFAILIYDEPDSAALRDQYRQTHLDYLKVFDAQTLFAGPFTTDNESADLGSLRLIEFPDRATADRHVAEELMSLVACRSGISTAGCPGSPIPGGIVHAPEAISRLCFMVWTSQVPGPCAKYRAAHEAYLAKHANMVMARGPLVSDDGEESIGSVFLLDVPDMDAARAFMEQEPFYSNGVYKDINFHRWRFGRVMDRFK